MGAWALLIAASLAISATRAPASTPAGAIAGRATDAVSGEPVDAATVVAEPGRRTVTTTADGRFVFSGLPPGSYRVEVSHVAYRPSGRIEVRVAPGVTQEIEIRLERNPVRESVVVRPRPAPSPDAERAVDLTGEEMSSAPGTLGDPVRGLTAVPGVSSINDLKGEVRIHGGDPGDTLFRMDGVVIGNPYHYRFSRASISGFNLAAFDSFAVRSSSLAPSVGDTVSGVIDLRPSERGERGGYLDAAVGTLTASAAGGGPIPGGSWVAAGRYSSLALYRNLYGVENLSVPLFRDLLLRGRTALSPRVSLVAGALLLDSDLSSSDSSDHSSTEVAAESRLAYAGFDAEIASRLRLSGRISRGRSHQTIRSTEGDDLAAREDRLGLSLDLEGGKEGDRAAWRVGLEETSLEGNYAGSIQSAGSIRPLSESSSRVGAHASVTFEPWARFTVDAGARIERDARRGSAPVQPRVAVTYLGAAGFKTWLSACRYVQFPRFEQEFLAQDNAVAPATADEIASGAAFDLGGGARLELTAFARRLKDATAELVNRLPDLPEPMGRFESGYSRGLDLSVRKERGRFRSRLALSLLRARETREGRESPGDGDQPYRVDLSANWLLTQRWELGGRLQVASGLPYSAYVPTGDGGRMLGPLNGGRLPTYARLDARANWDFAGFKGRGRLYVEIDNLLGRRNVRGRDLRYDLEKGRYYFRDDAAMPRVPAFGLEISWGN